MRVFYFCIVAFSSSFEINDFIESVRGVIESISGLGVSRNVRISVDISDPPFEKFGELKRFSWNPIGKVRGLIFLAQG